MHLPPTSVDDELGLPRSEVDSDGTEARRARLLRCVAENFLPPGNLETLEIRRDNRRLELCFQQSAGDSPGPEVDTLLGFLVHRLLHEDVGELQSSARLQHS